jgi:hypothetical protein
VFGKREDSAPNGVNSLPSFTADPAFAAQAAELFEHLMSLLEPHLQRVARLKMEGYATGWATEALLIALAELRH